MCGIAGLFDTECATLTESLHGIASNMADALRHRGPDDGGVWLSTSQGIALAHRRLAVIDLSPQGHQPMVSGSGRFVISLNGEIYNFIELRHELAAAGAVIDRRSDTAVLLAACEHWGVAEALERIEGMFAFALWDRTENRLTLARDRLGQKPLYYAWLGSNLVFASELKALLVHPAWQGQVENESVELLLRYGYIPAPWSIYRGVYKLPPGSWLRVGRGDSATAFAPFADSGDDSRLHPRRYWSLYQVADNPGRSPEPPPEQVADELEVVLRRAVRQQMISDVPIGAFLSGGVDSSTVVALMQAESSRPIKTFTVAFDQPEFDESPFAAAVARHLGTEHTELLITEREALESVPDLPYVFDEPFADSSQVPTLLISRLARKHITVCLTGDGGDEVFCGYNRYLGTAAVWRHLGKLPGSVRSTLGWLLMRLPPSAWDRIMAPRSATGLRPPSSRGHRVHKLARLLSGTDFDAMYRRAVALWADPGAVLTFDVSPTAGELPLRPLSAEHDLLARMMYWDSMYYLPDDNLTKVDRASMSVNLETRIPLLDRQVVEYAWTLSPDMKLRNGVTKWALRQVLYRHVPQALIERSKMGFSAPIGNWLCGPLREWAEDLLDLAGKDEQGLFNRKVIQACWTEHLSGRRNWQVELWTLLMFQAWKRAVGEKNWSSQQTPYTAVVVA